MLPQEVALARHRSLHASSPDPANVAPFYATGPPPEPPQPAVEHPYAKAERRRKQAELLRNAKEIRNEIRAGKNKTPLRKRFWKDVHVKEVDGVYQIYLDARPLRHPETKEIVNIPLTKPLLAYALALEWDLLTSAQQATKQHLIPLTSLTCRALDIAANDAVTSSDSTFSPIRTSITNMVLRYLDTDSLLCWAPPPREPQAEGEGSLRELQERTAGAIIGYLSTHVWPGVEIEPVLDEGSIMPRGQKEGVREVIQGWVMGLDAWELAALERAALAGKGLLGAARLLVEWSEGAAGQVGRDVAAAEGLGARRKFDVEEAARVASLEVDWQTSKWGEVEDTHDVEKVDLRRQLGSVVLLVSGTGPR
ncbi:DNA-directed DNA polymerase B [Cryphonectria parasitica EP155]|uniref:DNA-directed DNA polymerase B n=1 Tax=Cryphonectria parasitica (strain ATCC 38755 / EP155) TaxID=660469 RepID=A0A9P5CSY1_CRYP1|nr:DNA-directed DNA polymerase B [Cryphonectria parasitica EP155]KAF3768831.1 DNA-directed DNA polymerase B [Cryphonectria parasitica EP155]